MTKSAKLLGTIETSFYSESPEVLAMYLRRLETQEWFTTTDGVTARTMRVVAIEGDTEAGVMVRGTVTMEPQPEIISMARAMALGRKPRR